MARKPITPFLAQPAVSEGERKIAHLELHGARLYLWQGQEYSPRIMIPPITSFGGMLRGSAMQNGHWSFHSTPIAPPAIYKEIPWSKLQPEQLDLLEWSLIEQFLSHHRNSTH